MADHPVLGNRLAWVHLVGYGFLETEQLIVRKRAEKAFQQDHRFPKAGIQVVLIVVQDGPQCVVVEVHSVGQFCRSTPEVIV